MRPTAVALLILALFIAVGCGSGDDGGSSGECHVIENGDFGEMVVCPEEDE